MELEQDIEEKSQIDEMRKSFISDVSHELKTPISVISGYANLLDRWGKDDAETCNKSIQAIKNETKTFLKIFSFLLCFFTISL